MGFVLTGDNKGISIAPQLKTVYTINKKVGLGIEYYSDLGTFKKILPGQLAGTFDRPDDRSLC